MTTAPSILNLQDWPGREGVSVKPVRPQPFERLGDRSGIVFVAAAERYAPEERFGLGAYLSITGRSVLGRGLVVPDDRPDVSEVLQVWCRGRTVETPAGPRPWECQTLREFFDYRTGLFTRRVYTGAGWLVTADLGRTLGLVAEAWAPTRATKRSDFWRGGLKLYLPTWSKIDGRENHERRLDPVSPHRPAFLVKTAGAHGYVGQFDRGQGSASAGKRNPDGTPYRGRPLDVVTGGHVFDGVDSGELGDHLEAFGIDRIDLPAAVTLDADGAELMGNLVDVVRSLVLVLDEEAARWLTTSRDRARRYGRLDLGSSRLPSRAGGGDPAKGGRLSAVGQVPDPDRSGAEVLDRRSPWRMAHGRDGGKRTLPCG